MKKLILILGVLLSFLGHSQLPIIESYNSTFNGGYSTDVILTKPASVSNGDLLLILVTSDSEVDTDQFPSLSGWTRILQTGTSLSDAHTAAFYRIADGTEGATTTVTATNSHYMAGWYLRVSNVDNNKPLEATGSAIVAGTSADFDVPSVTTLNDNCLAFVLFAFDGGDGLPMVYTGTGWTKENEGSNPGTGDSDLSSTWGTKDMATAGATGVVNIDPAVNDGGSGFQFAIKGASTSSRRIFNINK
jgi:hypothetical protein